MAEVNYADLGSADQNKFKEFCATPHWPTLSAEVRTDEGEVLVSLDQGRGGGRKTCVTDGQVDVDADSAVGRFLALEVTDPEQKLIVAQDANFVNRQLRVFRSRYVPVLAATVVTDLFVGPIVAAPRTGDVVNFTAHGKPRYAMHGQREPYTLPAGMPKTTAIKKLLHELAGEPYSRLGGIPDLPAKLPKAMVIAINRYPLQAARELADSTDRRLFVGATGDWRFPRTDAQHLVYTFTDGTAGPGVAAAPPTAQTDWLGTYNAVRVTGGATDTKPAPVGYAFAPVDDPFSAQSLARFGVPQYKWHDVTVDTAHTQATVDRIAANTMARDLQGHLEVMWESILLDIFNEWDWVAVKTPAFSSQGYLMKFTIPLNLDGSPTATYGFSKRVSSNSYASRR